MIYVVFISLAICLPIIFHLTTREFHSWSLIKDRWFRAGIDNQMLFTGTNISSNRNDEESVRLDGEYNGCAVMLCTIKGKPSCSRIEINYPPDFCKGLRAYPADLFGYMTQLLENPEDEKSEMRFTVHEDLPKPLSKRLNPRISEQLAALRQDYYQRNRRFEISREKFKLEQPGLLVDPSPLLPVLDEMVETVNLLRENVEHLLVQ